MNSSSTCIRKVILLPNKISQSFIVLFLAEFTLVFLVQFMHYFFQALGIFCWILPDYASLLFVSCQKIFSVRSSYIPENIGCPSCRMNWAHYYEILQSDEYSIMIFSSTPSPLHVTSVFSSKAQTPASKS